MQVFSNKRLFFGHMADILVKLGSEVPFPELGVNYSHPHIKEMPLLVAATCSE